MHISNLTPPSLPNTPPSLIPLPRYGHVTPPPLPPRLNPRPNPRPPQQAPRHKYKPQNHNLILRRVPLKTSSHDFLLLLALAETIPEAELAVAIVATLLARARAQFEGEGGFGGGGGGVEGDDGAVAEAGAFAEGGWGWVVVLEMVFKRWGKSTYRLRGRARGRRGRSGRRGGSDAWLRWSVVAQWQWVRSAPVAEGCWYAVCGMRYAVCDMRC